MLGLTPRGVSVIIGIVDILPERISTLYRFVFRDGLSLEAALRKIDLASSSYYRWKKEHPDLNATLRRQAREAVAREIEDDRIRVSRSREIRQSEFEAALFEGALPVLRSMLDAAKQEGTVQEQIAALRELRQWLSSGALQSDGGSAAEQQPLLPASTSFPDFLAGEVKSVTIESVSGDKAMVERGALLEGSIVTDT